MNTVRLKPKAVLLFRLNYLLVITVNSRVYWRRVNQSANEVPLLKENCFMVFPHNWPAECPPEDAEHANGWVFRLVRNNPVSAEDFKSHKEVGRAPQAPECLRCGLSVFRNREDAEHLHKLFPRLGKFIARGELQELHGRVKLTIGRQPTHTTWWAHEGVVRHAPFVDVEEIP